MMKKEIHFEGIDYQKIFGLNNSAGIDDQLKKNIEIGDFVKVKTLVNKNSKSRSEDAKESVIGEVLYIDHRIVTLKLKNYPESFFLYEVELVKKANE